MIGGMVLNSSASSTENPKRWTEEGDLYVVLSMTESRALVSVAFGWTTYDTGHAAFVFICHRSVNSFTSSSRLASSCVLSHTSRAPGLAMVA